MRRKKDGTIGYIGNRRLNGEQNWLEGRITRLKNYQSWHGRRPEDVKKVLKKLREDYHQIPKAIEAANAGRRRANEAGLYRLDGQCGGALERRDVARHVGAEYLCVDFSALPYGDGWTYKIELKYAWFAPQWFTEYAHGMGDRRKMYRRFDKLKDQGQDAIDSEVGLLILGAA